jgi:hypothetical protein
MFIICRSKVLEKFETTILDDGDIPVAGAGILKHYFGDVFQKVLDLNEWKDFLRDEFAGKLRDPLQVRLLSECSHQVIQDDSVAT